MMMEEDKPKPKLHSMTHPDQVDGSLQRSLIHPDIKDDDPDAKQKVASMEAAAGGSRHLTLCDAICAPEGADQSHLTDHEKRLVEICKSDEFERDRLMWGGGLM